MDDCELLNVDSIIKLSLLLEKSFKLAEMHLDIYFESDHYGLKNRERYNAQQIGRHIYIPHEQGWDDLKNMDIVLLFTNEYRGSKIQQCDISTANTIRESFYNMYYWHNNIKIADLGNLINGAQLADTHYALSEVLSYLIHDLKKKVIIIGGGHDLTMEQYKVFRNKEEIIDCVVIDKVIDLVQEYQYAEEGFLYELLTSTPSFIKNFTMMGFQSYYCNPHVIETLDSLAFDCYRLGKLRDEIDEMEPAIRNSAIISIDMQAMKHGDARAIPSCSPNGIESQEICQLTRYAGMSEDGRTLGIFNIGALEQEQEQTIELIGQMIWYFIDGHYLQKLESPIGTSDLYNTYHVNADGQLLQFIANKRTNRWWIQLKENKYIPCTLSDYHTASQNQLPERYLRAFAKIDY
jgi:arginase family enzyme